MTLILMAGLSARCENANRPLALTLRPSVQVDSAGVFLSQVLAETPAGLTNSRLTSAPAVGQTIALLRAQVTQALQNQPGGFAFTNWSGPDRVSISRRVRQFEEQELKDLLTAILQREQARDRGELELRFSRPWSAITVPDEPVSLRVLELPLSGLSPYFIVRFELRTDREILGTWQMPMQAHLWREIWVARSPQPRGRNLSEADLVREKRDLLLIRDALLTEELISNSSLELSEYLGMGMPVLERSVRLRPVVHRGKQLEATVQEGSLLITVKVEALEDGIPGQLIRVRNTKSRKEFHAKVQSEQTVVVGL